jgi:hypothetical protein
MKPLSHDYVNHEFVGFKTISAAGPEGKSNGRESSLRRALASRPFKEETHVLVCLNQLLHKGQ